MGDRAATPDFRRVCLIKGTFPDICLKLLDRCLKNIQNELSS
jgi:hypothetical protein